MSLDAGQLLSHTSLHFFLLSFILACARAYVASVARLKA